MQTFEFPKNPMFKTSTAVIGDVAITFIHSKQKVEQPKPSDYVVGTPDVTNSPLAATMVPRIKETTAQDQMLVVDEDEDDDEFFEHPQGSCLKIFTKMT